jgi:hypothetical protein
MGHKLVMFRTTGFPDFVHHPEFQILEKTFWKLDLLASSGEGKGAPTLLGYLERANPNHWTTHHITTGT